MSSRPDTYRTGLWAETLCRLALRLRGYSIVASRYRTPLGEIDIVAARSKVLAIIEVKARPSRHQAAEAVSLHQQQRLTRAAAAFLARHPHFAGHVLRFDVMLVTPWRWPERIENAW